jgi:hypothetical protein
MHAAFHCLQFYAVVGSSHWMPQKPATEQLSVPDPVEKSYEERRANFEMTALASTCH